MPVRILIVEDEETLRESLVRVLVREGYEVEAAESSEAASRLIGEKMFDLMVTDIVLPGISGMELLKKCRKLVPALIVIIITAYATIETAVEAIRAGAFEYLVKPILHEELKSVIRKALAGRGKGKGKEMHIDHYSFGSITVGKKTYTSDVIIYPDRVDESWWRKEGHYLQKADLGDIIAAKPDLLIIGSGMNGIMQVPEETRTFLASHDIEVIIEKTGKAVEIFNDRPEGRKVIAALHLTC